MATLAEALMNVSIEYGSSLVSAAGSWSIDTSGYLQFKPASEADRLWLELGPRIEALIEAKLAALQSQKLAAPAPTTVEHVYIRTISGLPSFRFSPGSV